MPLLVSCSFHEDYTNCPETNADNGEHSNIKLILHINTDIDSRSRVSENPLGGEDGNGLRQGEHHENDIQDLCVFAFDSNSPTVGVAQLNAGSVVKYKRYVPDVNFTPTYSQSSANPLSTEVDLQFDGKIVGNNDAFLVVANMGDITEGITTLGQLRDRLVETPVTFPATGEPLANCNRFTMANAANSRNLGGIGTQANPYRISVDIERTTARVDFMYDNSLSESPDGIPAGQNLLGYKVVSRNDASIQTAWLYISHIKLMNVAQYAPYTLKRLAEQENFTHYYMADEEHVNDEAVRYVVEPNTWEKNKQGVSYATLYGDTRIQYVAENYKSSGMFTDRERVHQPSTPQTVPNANDGFNFGWSKDRISGEAYYVLDYINENTVDKEHTSGLNTTSLLLKTKFVPKVMYYSNDGVLAMNGSEPASKAAAYGTTFWSMEKSEKGKREKLYFETETAANAYKDKFPTATYAAPMKYENGDCYYTIWIRHDNNNINGNIGKMEYGIVRNNIYRIGVSSVMGPGTDKPTPEETLEDLRTRIFVRQWNLMNLPQINI